jgi:hypothetical protein
MYVCEHIYIYIYIYEYIRHIHHACIFVCVLVSQYAFLCVSIGFVRTNFHMLSAFSCRIIQQ